MGWNRPDKPAIPTVYYTFRAKDADSDQLVTYRVEDLTEDRYDDMIQHYKENFVDDEPFCENRKVSSHEDALEEIVLFWYWCFSQQTTIVCYKEGSDEIVGANLLHVKTPEKEEWPLHSKQISDIVATNEYMTDNCNLFEKFGVDKYLTAYGLAINRRYRGRGIATEMLKARVPMCKAFGLKLTATNFTAPGSQQAAAKAGFITDFEVAYDDFAKMGPKYAFPGINSKSLKLMSLKID
ncbi:conserved hypothetical protein [Culex quinquefasciatus]|uniref:N-acetyltransferase domain-containing protein n=1 Tax=Culex quinquefasciatus TaxID=7176 RepID=B0W0U2_CULQU|nr:conserved hypothetical protein [Culex quinquefasciatus]|eukprot:XP_001842326.1 conserved hypothetical protein [Culex quinquefasciatus]